MPSEWHCLAQSFPQRQQNPRFGAVVACPLVPLWHALSSSPLTTDLLSGIALPSPFRNGSKTCDSVPLWHQQPPHYRPSEWHCLAQSFPQRQQNPRFGAVVACGSATVYVDEIHTAFTLPGLRLCDAKSEEPIRPGHSYHAMSAVTGSWSSFRPISQTTAITLRGSRQGKSHRASSPDFSHDFHPSPLPCPRHLSCAA